MKGYTAKNIYISKGSKKMIKWIFFDLGSTLIDESECAEYRTQELLKQPNAPKNGNRTASYTIWYSPIF